MLTAVEETARQGIGNVARSGRCCSTRSTASAMQFRFYSQDLINNLFSHPYTKIQFVEHDLNVSRLTATKYLDALADAASWRTQNRPLELLHQRAAHAHLHR